MQYAHLLQQQVAHCSHGCELTPLPALPSQVFLRAGQMAVLDKLRADTMATAAICIQRHVKGHLTRKKFGTRRDAVLCFQSWVRGERHVLLWLPVPLQVVSCHMLGILRSLPRWSDCDCAACAHWRYCRCLQSLETRMIRSPTGSTCPQVARVPSLPFTSQCTASDVTSR